MLKKEDKVVMHTCGEADHYKGRIWTCRSDEFTSSAKQQVVFLEGFSGYFLVDYLQIVDLGNLLEAAAARTTEPSKRTGGKPPDG